MPPLHLHRDLTHQKRPCLVGYVIIDRLAFPPPRRPGHGGPQWRSGLSIALSSSATCTSGAPAPAPPTPPPSCATSSATTYYLVGDIIDMWRLRHRWHWPEEHNWVIRRILKLAQTRHPRPLHPRQPRRGRTAIRRPQLRRGSRSSMKRSIEPPTGASSSSPTATSSTWSCATTASSPCSAPPRNDRLVTCSRYYNVLRRAAGLPYWSLSQYVKLRVKGACTHIARSRRPSSAKRAGAGSTASSAGTSTSPRSAAAWSTTTTAATGWKAAPPSWNTKTARCILIDGNTACAAARAGGSQPRRGARRRCYPPALKQIRATRTCHRSPTPRYPTGRFTTEGDRVSSGGPGKHSRYTERRPTCCDRRLGGAPIAADGFQQVGNNRAAIGGTGGTMARMDQPLTGEAPAALRDLENSVVLRASSITAMRFFLQRSLACSASVENAGPCACAPVGLVSRSRGSLGSDMLLEFLDATVFPVVDGGHFDPE